MFPIRELLARLEELLDELDELAADAELDELDDLNAEFEDELMLISEIRQGTDEDREELRDALEDLAALAGDYRALAPRAPGIEGPAERLEKLAALAAGNVD